MGIAGKHLFQGRDHSPAPAIPKLSTNVRLTAIQFTVNITGQDRAAADAGYFQDPDRHLWEVVWNPQWAVKD